MVVRKEFTARCAGCKQPITLYNYEGLSSDSLMGSHFCDKQADVPEDKDLFTDLKEKK
jgi:hypothetical protein